jgi:hypothetical protein
MERFMENWKELLCSYLYHVLEDCKFWNGLHVVVVAAWEQEKEGVNASDFTYVLIS